MELPLLKELVVIFCLSSVVIYGCHRIKVPPIVGFLLTGMVCGPYGLKLLSAVHEVERLAEVGVVLLMFSIGMELSVSDLIRLRKPVFLGGLMQIGLTIAAVTPLMLFFDNQINHAIFAGCLVALSSTAIILNILLQTGQMDSPHGRVTLSILIFQDLAIVPMMLAIPLLSGADINAGESTFSLLLSGLKTLGIIVAVFLVARKLVPLGLAMIVRTRNRSLFLIATLGICLSIAWISSSLGLSLSLGAFMAGLIMSESEYSHSALEGVLPFKEVFTSLFFTSVGMLLDLHFFSTHLIEVAAIIMALLALKALVVTFVTLCLGYPLRPALIAGLALCQIGEFSFVLAKEGQKFHLLLDEHYQIFLAASIMTMAAAPFLLAGAPRFAAAVTRLRLFVFLFGRHRLRGTVIRPADTGLSDHLIIIGFGVGGKYLARTAKVAGLPYTILEMNPDTVRAYAAKGEPISYGDATNPAILRALGITRAHVLAIVISDPVATRSLIKTARQLAPGLHIVARTRFFAEIQALYELGASDVIPEELEAAVEIFTRVLSRYLVPRADIENFVSEVRAESYAMLRSLDLPGAALGALQKRIPHLNVTAITVEPSSHMDGMSLLQAELRQKTGVSAIAVLRGEQLFANPDGTFHTLAGDVVYIFATSEAMREAARLFTSGTGK